jgi:hypothetical protein
VSNTLLELFPLIGSSREGSDMYGSIKLRATAKVAVGRSRRTDSVLVNMFMLQYYRSES